MTIRIVGAGVGRTGTHSLKNALETLLGGKCHHMIEVFEHLDEAPVWHAAADGSMPDWHEFLAGYNAIVDWPGGAFWPELAAAFPDAPVLLSTRPAADWYRSAQNTIFNALDLTSPPGADPWQDMVGAMFRKRFCADLQDAPAMMAAFDAHNAAVRAAIPKERLVEWTATDGWEPICEALELPVPNEPFPITNTTKEFREMLGLDPV